MIDWKKLPASLWLLVLLMSIGTASVEVSAHGPLPAKVILAAIILAWIYLLLRGVRWIWILTVVLYIFSLLNEGLSNPGEWWTLVIGFIGLILLMLPGTRRHFRLEPIQKDREAI